jgi:transposase, IS5 family
VSRTAERQVSFADWELMRQGLRLEPLLQAISDFLDDQKDMIEQVRCDLTRGLKKAETGRSGLTPQQILRSLILMRIKNWDYRELRERIADGCTLRQFTVLSAGATTRCVPPRLQSAHARDAQGDQ